MTSSWHYTYICSTGWAAVLLSQNVNGFAVQGYVVLWQLHKTFTDLLCNQLEADNFCSR
jgi:hypothetical protein